MVRARLLAPLLPFGTRTLAMASSREEVNPLDVTWQDLRQLLEGTPLKPVSQRAVKLPKYVI